MAQDPSAESVARRVAVIDIGTNSTRLLVADVVPATRAVSEVTRQSTVTRLGRGVDLSGALSSEAIEDVCRAISSYMETYSELGAESVTAIATSAVRDSTNGDAFLAELRERFGLDAQLIDGGREASYTYDGATAETLPDRSTLVVDIGGGSTELVLGTGRDVAFHTSLQAGVVRHTERHLVKDPPSVAQLEALASDVRSLMDIALDGEVALQAERGIGVAGTPTSLAAIDQQLEPYDSQKVHGYELSLSEIQKYMGRLAGMPAHERAEVPGLHPDRAPTIVAGVVILIETMRAFGLDRITVSEHDILYGVALDSASNL